MKHSQATVDAVAIDMSPAYISAVMKHLPGAVIVFDHFHVVKLFNDKLSDLRRDLYREAKDQLQKDVLKGTRWLLLKNPGNLDEKIRRKGAPQRSSPAESTALHCLLPQGRSEGGMDSARQKTGAESS